jgi:hypothetical protein
LIFIGVSNSIPPLNDSFRYHTNRIFLLIYQISNESQPAADARLVALAKTGSFTLAADHLNVTQSA